MRYHDRKTAADTGHKGTSDGNIRTIAEKQLMIPDAKELDKKA
jgi:hypothetical protein